VVQGVNLPPIGASAPVPSAEEKSPVEAAAGEWRRIVVTSEGGRLRYQVATGDLRMDETLSSEQLGLVASYVAGLSGRALVEGRAGVTLFEMLFPARLRDWLVMQRVNLLLVVDPGAAWLPWELLARDTESGAVEPIATGRGLLRQVQPQASPSERSAPGECRALVIGDTPSSYSEIPAAQHEARNLADMLRARGCPVTLRVRPETRELLAEFFERAYEILHIAAHAVSDPSNLHREGIALGDDRFLGVAEFVKMRVSPGLVFLNCSGDALYLQSIDAPAEASTSLTTRIAQELLGRGTQAVIVTGWPLDDAAAMTFAAAFYEVMLAGHPFGDAVLHARRETRALHPDNSTWAAYQCYGDPFFRLKLPSPQEREPEGSAREPSLAEDAPVLVYLSYAQENLDAARRINNALERAGVKTWFYERIILPADRWVEKSRQAIQKCALFVPLLSRQSVARTEGGFWREWHDAVDRSSRMPPDQPFVLPLVIEEGGSLHAEDVPAPLRDIHWGHAPQGELSGELLERIKNLVRSSSPESIIHGSSAAAPSHWVLVAGQGTYELPPVAASVAGELGQALADAGYGLVVGGWQGVDHVVARAFGKRTRELGRAEVEWLRQVVPHGQGPDYSGGHIEHTTDEWGVSTEQAEAAILVSGSGGTQQLGKMMRAARKPVFPLASTGGDAAEFWARMTQGWEAMPVPGLQRKDFDEIGPSGSDPVGAVISMLQKVFTAPS
jgi:hypothetical protein